MTQKSAANREQIERALMSETLPEFLLRKGHNEVYDLVTVKRSRGGVVMRERLKGATVIVVSHQAKTLEKFCTSAAVLRHGQLHSRATARRPDRAARARLRPAAGCRRGLVES